MKILYFAFAATLILLAGCVEKNRNQAQYDFVRQLDKVKDDLLELQTSNFLNKGQGGRLLPEDIDQQIAGKKAELDAMFQNPPAAESWNASVVTLKRDGRTIIIVAGYGSTTYRLKIIAPEAKKIAENLREDDDIQFSGRLMAEKSKTLLGAFIYPEFTVYPTKVARRDLVLIQAEQPAEDGRKAEIKAVVDAKKQRADKQEEKELKQRIKEICQETVLKNLKYPASAYFPTLVKQYDKGPDGSWIYSDIVSAKNEFGGDIPRRFQCAGHVEVEDIVVKLSFLD